MQSICFSRCGPLFLCFSGPLFLCFSVSLFKKKEKKERKKEFVFLFVCLPVSVSRSLNSLRVFTGVWFRGMHACACAVASDLRCGQPIASLAGFRASATSTQTASRRQPTENSSTKVATGASGAGGRIKGPTCRCPYRSIVQTLVCRGSRRARGSSLRPPPTTRTSPRRTCNGTSATLGTATRCKRPRPSDRFALLLKVSRGPCDSRHPVGWALCDAAIEPAPAPGGLNYTMSHRPPSTPRNTPTYCRSKIVLIVSRSSACVLLVTTNDRCNIL
jgi:hypothetical protein